MNFKLDVDKIVQKIGDSNKVVLQLPDGLKSEGKKLVSELEDKTDATIFLWMGSNYGGCDYPFYLEDLDFDLLINVGHNRVVNKG